MPKVDIARALKDKDYFNSLSEEEKGQVRAADPTGDLEVTDDNLDSVSGGLLGGDVVAPDTGTGSSAQNPTFGSAAEGTCNCNC